MKPRRRDERAQARDEVLGREHHGVRPVAPRPLEAINDLPVVTKREAVERQRRPRHVPQYVLESLSVAAVDRDLRVHVHTAVLCERSRLLAHGAHRLHELQRLLPRALAEELHIARRRRDTRRQHRLIMGELRGLVPNAVERATVREEHLLDARVRPPRHLLDLRERGRAERVELERAGTGTHIHAIEKQGVRVDVEAIGLPLQGVRAKSWIISIR